MGEEYVGLFMREIGSIGRDLIFLLMAGAATASYGQSEDLSDLDLFRAQIGLNAFAASPSQSNENQSAEPSTLSRKRFGINANIPLIGGIERRPAKAYKVLANFKYDRSRFALPALQSPEILFTRTTLGASGWYLSREGSQYMAAVSARLSQEVGTGRKLLGGGGLGLVSTNPAGNLSWLYGAVLGQTDWHVGALPLLGFSYKFSDTWRTTWLLPLRADVMASPNKTFDLGLVAYVSGFIAPFSPLEQDQEHYLFVDQQLRMGFKALAKPTSKLQLTAEIGRIVASKIQVLNNSDALYESKFAAGSYAVLTAAFQFGGSPFHRNRDEAKTTPGDSHDAERLSPGNHEFTLTYQGKDRRYIVHVPKSYQHQLRIPVLFVLHGGGGNAAGINSFSHTTEASEGAGYLVVYPEGTGRKLGGNSINTWNAGSCCGSAKEQNIDDVGFLSLVIDLVERDYSVDKHRVFMTGLSNGGMMSFRMGCELSERIAAIAPVAAEGGFSECPLKRSVPTLVFHGTEDPCVPYAGGNGADGDCFLGYIGELIGVKLSPRESKSTRGALAFHETWKSLNRISVKSSVVVEKSGIKCIVASEANTEVELCTIVGGGHSWPGGGEGGACEKNSESRNCKLYLKHTGPVSQAVNATSAMWEFFQRHPLP